MRCSRLFRLSGGRIVQVLAVLLATMLPISALAVNPDEMLPDPAKESRARTLSAELRCMVCQNQSIDDSNAELARDLRLLVRDRIKHGESDEQVLNYIVSRYGEFVLLRPRFSVRTMALWGSPLVLILAGGLSLLVFSRRSARRPTGTCLNSEEETRLQKLLNSPHL
ncbi:cytochrome c-type biogenesis protein CcmH [Rhizobium sp. 16-488-2a]|nr:cytochrome c-type biogenesis protein CcmH [Rhizobium sp. 16-488-2b]MBO9177464.1 cytochrome c-type biogenesis protein CcmH [Rhizobium sp. 16-488-2a]